MIVEEKDESLDVVEKKIGMVIVLKLGQQVGNDWLRCMKRVLYANLSFFIFQSLL